MDDTTILRIMTEDPLKCTDQDIEALVADYRAKRHLYALGDQRAGSTKKTSSAVKVKLDL